MANVKKTDTISVGPDTDLTKETFLHFEELSRRIIAENPNCPPEIIEDYKKLKQANKAVKNYESLKALSELAKANIDSLAEDGIFRVRQLAFLSLQESTSAIKKEDWSIIAHHFSCKQELTDVDVSRIRDALRQYHSRNKLGVQPLPEDLNSVFDRLFTPESESTKPKQAPSRGGLVLTLQRIQSLSKLSKAAVATMFVWTIYVSYRTYGYHELLGNNLEQWNDDNFFANLLIIPLSLAAVVFIIRWILADKK